MNAIPYYQPYPPPPYGMQQPRLQGRVVMGEAEISPGEVGMGELPCYFPQSDGSCIIAKSWNADGTIKTVRYVPEGDKPDEMAGIEARLDALEKAMKGGKKRKEADDA